MQIIVLSFFVVVWSIKPYFSILPHDEYACKSGQAREMYASVFNASNGNQP